MSSSRIRGFVSRIGVCRCLAIGLVIMSFAVLPYPALAKSAGNSGKGKAAVKKSPPKPKLSKTAKFEIEYLKKSVDRHVRMIQRMKQVDTLTTDVEVLAFAHVFVAREQDELTTMTGWLSSWYKITYAPKAPKSVWGLDDDVDADASILACVMGYDHSEIAWAGQVLRKAGHTELKDMARQTKLTNRAEILQLQDMLTALEDEAETEDEPEPTE